ncbi:MAG: Na+/H+ antiporter subunit E [Jatrophihabitantaceae bacterium]
MITRVAALFVWAYATWLLLTWTLTFEQLVFGGLLALAVALAMSPFGEVAPPWRLLDPRVLVAVCVLVAVALGKIVRANLGLARRILSPSRPLASGMVVVPTRMRGDAGIGGVGLITSLIVDNQIVDVDREKHELQYHAVDVPEGTQAKVDAINGPVEQLLAPILRRP